jgi:hypothetical protein
MSVTGDHRRVSCLGTTTNLHDMTLQVTRQGHSEMVFRPYYKRPCNFSSCTHWRLCHKQVRHQVS